MTATDHPLAGRRETQAARVLAVLPDLIPVFFAFLGLACTGLLLLEQFSGPLALALAVVLTAVTARGLAPDQVARTRRDGRLDLAAVLLALSFAAFNGMYSDQDVVVARDPGVYAVTAVWLTDHRTLDIDTEARLFGTEPGLNYASAGFGPTLEPDHIYSQGAHVVPAILAVVGSIVGNDIMLRSNAVIGGLALLAAYALGRRLVGRGAALAAVLLMAVTLPQLAFVRGSYTEPYSQLMVLGGLALLWRARAGRRLDWALAGLVLGASCLARIDAYLVLPFVVAYAGLRMSLTGRAAPGATGQTRRAAAADAAVLLAAAALPAVLGFLDLTRLSFGYYRDLREQFLSIMALLVVAVVGTAVVVAVAWATPSVDWLRRRDQRWWVRLGTLGALGVVLAGVALAARPLLYTAHGIVDPRQIQEIATFQKGEGSPIDGARSYAEQSVTWLAWYLGPVVAGAALFGTALLVRRTVITRDVLAVPFLLVMLSTSALYLVNPSITPDQIWAMRRYVPVVLPGAAFAAMYALGLLLLRFRGRSRQLVAVGLAVVVLGPVLFITRPFLLVKQGVPQLAEVQRVCAALPDNAAVLLVGSLAVRYPMTVRTFCDVPTVAQPTLDVARAQLARTALAKTGRELYLLSSDEGIKDVPVEAGVLPTPMSTVAVRTWAKTLKTPPRQAPPRLRDLFLGRIGPQGTVVSWVAR